MLRLTFSPSRYLAGLLVLAHAIAIASIWALDWPGWLKPAVSLTIIASCAFYLWRDALLRAPGSVVSALLKDDGSVEVTRRDGMTASGRQVPGSFVHPWLTTILWRAEGARFSRAIPVLPDSMPVEQFRALRVWLKWRRVEKAGS